MSPTSLALPEGPCANPFPHYQPSHPRRGASVYYLRNRKRGPSDLHFGKRHWQCVAGYDRRKTAQPTPGRIALDEPELSTRARLSSALGESWLQKGLGEATRPRPPLDKLLSLLFPHRIPLHVEAKGGMSWSHLQVPQLHVLGHVVSPRWELWYPVQQGECVSPTPTPTGCDPTLRETVSLSTAAGNLWPACKRGRHQLESCKLGGCPS